MADEGEESKKNGEGHKIKLYCNENVQKWL